jgi:PAS domain S-box-containing protein
MADKKQRKPDVKQPGMKKTDRPSELSFCDKSPDPVRHSADKDLQKWDEKFYSLVENSPEGITVTQDGIRKFANKRFADMLGYSKEDIVGKPFIDITYPADREASIDRYQRRIAGETISSIQSRVIDNEGNIKWIEISGGPIMWEGRPAALIIVSDVTDKKIIQDMLKESEERYRLLVENAGEGIWVIHDGKFVLVNKKATEILGYTEEELLNKQYITLVHPDEKKLQLRNFQARLRGEHVPTYQTRIFDKKGNIRWVEINGTAITFRGEPGVLSLVTDITERVQNEEKFKEWQEKYFTLVEQASEGITVSQDGIRKFANRKYAEILGYSPEELIGKPITDVIYPDDRESSLLRYQNRLKGETFPTVKVRLVDKAGNIKWVEHSGGLITWEGKPAVLNVTTDITERKQFEDALIESEKKYFTLIENAIVGIMVAQDGVRKFVNQKFAEILGYSKDELIGKPFIDTIHPDDREIIILRNEQRLRGEKLPILRGRLLTKDGTIKWCEFNGIFINWEDRPAALNFITDITEQKRLEDERLQLFDEIKGINTKLSRSNRNLQDFALTVSSALQEPLRKIKAFSELLQESLAKTLNEDQRENFHFVIDGASRMQSVINDLRLYSQITTKAKESNPVDMRNLIAELITQELETQLKETKGTIEIIDPLLTVYGDVIQIRQLLFNLLNNGLKFHKDGVPPKVTVRSKQATGTMVLVEIQDNGIGIAKEHHENIFSMLFMLHPRTQYGGSGMGLAIAKQIVNRLGGEIGVKSAPDTGSTFWFTLPSKPIPDDRETG